MTEQTSKQSIHSIFGKMEVPYRYFVGALASKFFIELSNEKIMGVKCPQCNKVYLPPKSICSTCLNKLDQWVQLSGKGTVETYTVVDYAESVHPIPAPFAYAVIKLDGADTGLTHFLGEVEFDKITIGMRVEPVFKKEKEKTILDIKYFKPV